MAPTILYIASVFGALGLYLFLRTGGPEALRPRAIRGVGAVLGLGAFGYLLLIATRWIAPGVVGVRPDVFYLLFSGIALISAVQLVSTSRPVYSALYFVLVVLASAGLFLLLEAEFMAFALIIVYAGAILITYMFVLMLAQQAPNPDDPHGQPEYDLNPREPAAGAIVGFVLLALLSRMAVEGVANGLPDRPSETAARAQAWSETGRMPERLRTFVAETGAFPGASDGDFEIGWAGVETPVRVEGDGAVVLFTTADGVGHELALPEEMLPENVQQVGLGLMSIPVFSLELAGIILLMAMFGAVILARRQIELTEDETREAAGMRRLGHHDEPETAGGGGR